MMFRVKVLMPKDKSVLQDRLAILLAEQVKEMLTAEELEYYVGKLKERRIIGGWLWDK